MRFRLATAAFAALALVPSTAAAQTVPGDGGAHARESVGRIEGYLGQRSLDDDFWVSDDQPMLGAAFVSTPGPSRFSWEAGLLVSAEEDDVGGNDVTQAIAEAFGGGRFWLTDRSFAPYVGAGVCHLAAVVDPDNASDDDDTSFGFYGHAGFAARVSDIFHIGLDLRAVGGTDIELNGADGDADYVQLALTLGWSL